MSNIAGARKITHTKITTFTVLGKIRPTDLLSLWGIYESLPHMKSLNPL